MVEKPNALFQPHAMKTRCWLLPTLVGLLVAGCQKESTAQKPVPVTNSNVAAMVPGWPPTGPQLKLTTTKLFLGNEEVSAELALTHLQIMTGMMFRTNMLENEGMLFVFPNADQRAFYMKNTLIPLTVAYIDPDGVIVELHDLKPREEAPVLSKSDQIQFVLEMKQSWFSRHNINPGTVVATERGSLREFFQRKR
jgi:uncharacterized protein